MLCFFTGRTSRVVNSKLRLFRGHSSRLLPVVKRPSYTTTSNPNSPELRSQPTSLKAILHEVLDKSDSRKTEGGNVFFMPYDARDQMRNVLRIANGFALAIGNPNKKLPRGVVVYGISGGGKTRFALELPSLLLKACETPQQILDNEWPYETTEYKNSPIESENEDPKKVEPEFKLFLKSKVVKLKKALTGNVKQVYIDWIHNGQTFQEVERAWSPELILGLRTAAYYWYPHISYKTVCDKMNSHPFLQQFDLKKVLETIAKEDPNITALNIIMDEFQITTTETIQSRSSSAKDGELELLSRSLAHTLASTSRQFSDFFVFGTFAGTSIEPVTLLNNPTDDVFVRVPVQRLSITSVENIITNCLGNSSLEQKGFSALIKLVSGIPRAVEVLLLLLLKEPCTSIDLQSWHQRFLANYVNAFSSESLFNEKTGPQLWPLFLSAAGYNVYRLSTIGGTVQHPQTLENVLRSGVATVLSPSPKEKWLPVYQNITQIPEVRLLDVPLPWLMIASKLTLSGSIYSPKTKHNFSDSQAMTLQYQLYFLVNEAYITSYGFEKVALFHLVFRWNIFNFTEEGPTVRAASLFMGGLHQMAFGEIKFIKEQDLIKFHHASVQGVWAGPKKRGRKSKRSKMTGVVTEKKKKLLPFVRLVMTDIVRFDDMSPDHRGLLFGGTNMFDGHLRLWTQDGNGKKKIAIVWIDTKHTNTGETKLTVEEVEQISTKRRFLERSLPNFLHLAVKYSNRHYSGLIPSDPYTCVIDEAGLAYATAPVLNQLMERK
eukprot:TRINITY_DN15596_c0_g1_i2.p1 TRINITY_DN15596_c0_g1~~TRINITY_DN15596_c0_g1_i2.p1  ORF type:complete len:773 (+),score=47.87 TRINITY_DN15596_c0_g1_i2:51-2369(+)